MSVLSRSVTAAQRGRSFAGAPAFGTEETPGPEGSTCRCSSAGQAPGAFGTRREAEGRGRPSPPPGLETAAGSRIGGGPGTVTVLYPVQPPADQGSASPGRTRRADRFRGSFPHREAGMATAEYAIATLAAVAFAALLVAVLGSGEVRSLLMGLIRSALTLG